MKGGPAIREDLAPLNGALLKGNEEGFGLVKREKRSGTDSRGLVSC